MPSRTDNQAPIRGVSLEKKIKIRRSNDASPAYLDYRVCKERESLSLSVPSLSSTNKGLINVIAVQFITTLIMTGWEVKKQKEGEKKKKTKKKEIKNPDFREHF